MKRLNPDDVMQHLHIEHENDNRAWIEILIGKAAEMDSVDGADDYERSMMLISFWWERRNVMPELKTAWREFKEPPK